MDTDDGHPVDRLLDPFAALVSFGLAIDAACPAALALCTRAAAQRQARVLLDAARAAATAGTNSAAHIESASFAVVAWLDEVFARQARWVDPCTPLQMQLFNSGDAQSEFFHHLAGLQADDDAVREVYWHMLALGFAGQYGFEDGDEGELGKLKALHARQLRTPPLTLATLAQDHLTPQPYETPDPPGPRDPAPRGRKALRAGGVLALLLPLVALVPVLLAGPGATRLTAAEQLTREMSTYACSDLRATLDGDGTTRVSGFVPLPDDVARVEHDVRARPGMQATRFDLRLRVWPHCEVVDILKPYQARNHEKAFGLRIDAPSAHEGRLREGNPVQIQLWAANYDGYVQVDYFTADGAVQHLNRGPRQAYMAAGQSTAFGQDIPASWLVSPPFGPVLVSVLSSPVPFTELGQPPPFELASTYLLKLREALAANKGGDRVIAQLLLLETAAR